MAEALKECYSQDVVEQLGAAIHRVDQRFNPAQFQALVFDETWPARELKDRMHHLARCIYAGMSGSYSVKIKRLMSISASFRGLPYLVFPDIVEQYGLNDWEASIPALEVFTASCSSEFAVRPFILRDTKRMMKHMKAWAKHPDEQVRRLASEGCRPRLPWAMALPAFQRDPAPVIPILETLRDDSSEYVRRSVANNLNDISKDHPELVLTIATQWLGQEPTENMNRLVKHACRTLLKKGNPKAMALFGFHANHNALVHNLKITPTLLALGDSVLFMFTIQTKKANPVSLRLEYAIDYLKARGQHHRKVFQITERTFLKAEVITKRHAMKDLTTRVHHRGKHHLHILVNGRVAASASFELT